MPIPESVKRRFERITRLGYLLLRADAEREAPGYRGGLEAAKVRSEHVLAWQKELNSLDREQARWDAGPR